MSGVGTEYLKEMRVTCIAGNKLLASYLRRGRCPVWIDRGDTESLQQLRIRVVLIRIRGRCTISQVQVAGRGCAGIMAGHAGVRRTVLIPQRLNDRVVVDHNATIRVPAIRKRTRLRGWQRRGEGWIVIR